MLRRPAPWQGVSDRSRNNHANPAPWKKPFRIIELKGLPLSHGCDNRQICQSVTDSHQS